MARCFLCGARSAGPTCDQCREAPVAADTPPAAVTASFFPGADEPDEPETAGAGDLSAPPSLAGPSEADRPVVPPATNLKKIERWNSILDESPVFAGQGAFEVLTPPTPPAGTLDVAIGVRFDVASAPADADPVVHMLVTLSPYGAPLMSRSNGPVAHVILCLDLSASMNQPDKYPLLTKALAGMFRDLRSRFSEPVLVSVVAFAYGADVLLDAVPSTVLDERSVLDALDRWPKRFTRYTDVVGALRHAGRIARDSVASCKAMPVRIYVLTDGRPQDMPGARAVMGRIAKLPVDVHGLAFGDDADVDAMQQIVSGGRGATVKHVRGDSIGDAFGRIGEVAQLVVANRALLDVELRGGVIGGGAYRYRPARYRYGPSSFAKGVHFSTDLGTLESGRTYSALFQLRLRRAKTAETEIGRVCLRVPGFGGPRTFEKLVCIQRHPGTEVRERDPEVTTAIDVVTALDSRDVATNLKALQVRRRIYEAERRDPHILSVLDKAIRELETRGNLTALSPAEHAALISHTLTRRAPSPAARRADDAVVHPADLVEAPTVAVPVATPVGEDNLHDDSVAALSLDDTNEVSGGRA